MKTLVVILNHNLPDYTNKLYESLKPFEKDFALLHQVIDVARQV